MTEASPLTVAKEAQWVDGFRRIASRILGLDRVVAATLAILAALALWVPDQAIDSVVFTAGSLASIAPFLIASVLIAAGAKATAVDRQVAAVFTGRPVRVIAAAAAFGALSPFCSCGVVPIIAGLLGAGVPLAPVMAFWIASPLMDPEMFILMLTAFTPGFVFAKALAAFAMGAAAGGITHALSRNRAFTAPLKIGVGGGCGSRCGVGLPATAPLLWRFWREPERRAVFNAELRANGWFLGKWLTLAFLIESLMVAYLPADAIANSLDAAGVWLIPAAAAVGVPAYLNGYAAIPTVSTLIGMGLAPGAALAFMLAGGVTSIPAAMAVYALVRRPVFALYLALGFAGSVLAGFAYQIGVTG